MKRKTYPHGAVDPVIFEISKKSRWPSVALRFSATCADFDKYPVHFYGLDNIKDLHKWIGEQIKIAENGTTGGK